jgi:phosphoribosylformylglycinamidine synthase subunit PurQ / glutaminase
MASPSVLVLRAPGTNCDQETAFAFEQAGGRAQIAHVNRLLDDPQMPAEFQILCIPGGFSFGDDIAAGKIFANLIRHHLQETLAEFQAAGKLILGICNGFQVLIKSGLLLADTDQGPPATLMWNDSGKYEDRWVRLQAESQRCVFLQGIEALELPVAHAEGKFITRDHQTLAQLESRNQLCLRYDRRQGNGPGRGQITYPENPNGSQANVAGVCDVTGRVFGLMPHPERYIDPTHHPQWTRRPVPQQADGMQIFRNAIQYFA